MKRRRGLIPLNSAEAEQTLRSRDAGFYSCYQSGATSLQRGTWGAGIPSPLRDCKTRDSTGEAYYCVILVITPPARQINRLHSAVEKLFICVFLNSLGWLWRGADAPACHPLPGDSLIISWPPPLLRHCGGLFTWRFIRHSISINNAAWQILYKAEYEVSLTATNKWGEMDDVIRLERETQAARGGSGGFSSSLHLKLF